MFKKKVITGLLALLITVCGAGTVCNAESMILEDGRTLVLCDANKDKNVDILDLVRIKKHLSDSSVEISVAADVDQDGKITSVDLAELRKILLSPENMNPNNGVWSSGYY